MIQTIAARKRFEFLPECFSSSTSSPLLLRNWQVLFLLNGVSILPCKLFFVSNKSQVFSPIFLLISVEMLSEIPSLALFRAQTPKRG